MSMSVEAMNALSGIVNDSARTGIASYEASVQDEDRKRQALIERLRLGRHYGEDTSGLEQELVNGQDMAGRLKTLFGMNKQSVATGPIVGGVQVIPVNTDEQSVVDKLVARAQGHGAFETAQSDIMNDRGGKLANVDITKTKNQSGQALDERQKAFILADAESRKNTGKALSISEFQKVYDDQNAEVGVVEQNPNGDYVQVGTERNKKNNFLKRNEYANKIANMQAVAGDNKAIEEENKKLARTQIKNAEKEEKLHTDIAYKRALDVPAHKKYQGDFSEQTALAEEEYFPLINKYVSEGKYNKAELLESKYNVAMTAIYKKFDDKWANRKLFEKPKGGVKGPKIQTFQITDASGNPVGSTELKQGDLLPENYERTMAGLRKKGILVGDQKIALGSGNTSGGELSSQADAAKKQFDTNTEKTANLKTTIDDDLGWWTRLGKSDEERRKAWNEKHPENRIEMEADGMYAMKGGGDTSNIAGGGNGNQTQAGVSDGGGDKLVEENVNYNGKVYKKYKRADGTYYLK